jgi:Domain of unknown function (DUF4160)
MPTISIFYGISVRMYLNDHLPAHFHAMYGGHEATYIIESGLLMEGRLPKTAERLVQQWLALNQEAMMENWRLIRGGSLPNRIGGLDAE